MSNYRATRRPNSKKSGKSSFPKFSKIRNLSDLRNFLSLKNIREIDWHETLELTRRNFRRFMVLGAAIGALLMYLLLLMSGSARNLLPTSTGANEIAGQVALTQEELVNLVNSNNVVAYWVGPQDNTKYALTITADKQIFIKYLPNGQGIGDLKPNYKVIATYPESAAYDITRAAGTQSTSISFINSDGAAVYYSKDRATNVYVAFTGTPYEIEIFDPNAAVALDSATKPGGVVQIK